jgi:hypothetical protein
MATKVVNPITQIDRQVCRELSKDVLWMIEEHLAENGLVGQYVGGSFSPTEFKMRLRISIKPTGGKSLEQAQFEQSVKLYSNYYPWLKPEHYGKTFTVGRKVWKLVGFQPKRRKYPFVVEGVQGGRYKLPTLDVQGALGGGVINHPVKRGTSQASSPGRMWKQGEELTKCPKCKKLAVRSTQRKVGPEAVLVTYRCTTPRCTYTSQDILD